MDIPLGNHLTKWGDFHGHVWFSGAISHVVSNGWWVLSPFWLVKIPSHDSQFCLNFLKSLAASTGGCFSFYCWHQYWLVVWNFCYFPYINPNWHSYFSEWLKPPTRSSWIDKLIYFYGSFRSFSIAMWICKRVPSRFSSLEPGRWLLEWLGVPAKIQPRIAYYLHDRQASEAKRPACDGFCMGKMLDRSEKCVLYFGWKRWRPILQYSLVWFVFAVSMGTLWTSPVLDGLQALGWRVLFWCLQFWCPKIEWFTAIE